ncbi:MAG: sulfurtransferase/chromate resistance protein [Beijerinckiaceae bacterium]|nr:sulfurtransferase/chromate resistance protein [Beijerinckiaceae bacterium]
MSSINSISIEQLGRLIGTPKAPVLLDVRIDEDFDLSRRLIPGSERLGYQDVRQAISAWQGRNVVVICQKGKKLSEGAAAVLRADGIPAESLFGGYLAWTEAGLPTTSADVMPPKVDGATIWVTRERPKIDRIACPWLIRRFIDPAARFLFVSPAEVIAVAERFGATPFDVEDVQWTHRGERCTLDVLIEEFGLSTPALDRLATIVRAADTARLDLAPEAAGLLAISLGLSRMHSKDLEQLDGGMLVYDALYRWCRDATNETHNWPVRGSN